MSRLPVKFVLNIKPKEYLKQGLSNCGACCVKGILSAYGMDKTKHPKEYHSNWFNKVTGLTTNRQYWPNVLKSFGVKAKSRRANGLADENKLKVLKRLLIKGNPVMISVGNGYLPSGKYNPLLGKLMAHWITIWGYDDRKDTFYVYDSSLPKARYDKKVPAGNTKRAYDEILRDWKGSLLLAVRGVFSYQYIEISI